ncbi:HNH endonuclease [Hymenobacter gelipurpurascens]|uniref:HNH endonuclease n=1 Tax=Hymenobacter gelipurpurascens TaxID=89968 RepID=A0A212T913_9BACT|nr:HNH endonuclease [Hymenobacter gelipurpurascens]SNC62350.1 HNH endonuclease [Hymenobacter gelipurpurascens]
MKLRRVGKNRDPETGEVQYFKAGSYGKTPARIQADYYPPDKPPSKGKKARRRKRQKEKYATCPPRPLFHAETPKLTPSQRKTIRQQLIARDGNHCQQCNSRLYLTIDHIVPRGRGGGNHLGNLQLLCLPCNEAKGDKMPYELDQAA